MPIDSIGHSIGIYNWRLQGDQAILQGVSETLHELIPMERTTALQSPAQLRIVVLIPKHVWTKNKFLPRDFTQAAASTNSRTLPFSLATVPDEASSLKIFFSQSLRRYPARATFSNR